MKDNTWPWSKTLESKAGDFTELWTRLFKYFFSNVKTSSMKSIDVRSQIFLQPFIGIIFTLWISRYQEQSSSETEPPVEKKTQNKIETFYF